MVTVKQLILKFILKFLSITTTKRFWRKVHREALFQMNFGNGGDFRESGEPKALEFLNSEFNNETHLIIFDAGANKGNYAKVLHQTFGAKGKIFCFEPSHKTFKTLQSNTNNLENIACFNVGFSDKAQKQIFFSSTTHTGLASLYQRRIDLQGTVLSETEEVELTTIDNFCKEQSINRIHFLKLDIEGHELSALRGAASMLQEGRIDFIQFEFGSVNIDSRSYFRDFFYLLNERYKLFRIGKDSLLPVDEYNEWMEVFLTTNYLATKRG